MSEQSEVTGMYQPAGEGPGQIIGPYKLLQQIGAGGFGVVYMAEQDRPVRRIVALKIIRPGMDSEQVIARFESERQALALMDHPNIAKVLDAGATHTGQPYFVMELVKGVPITEFCDKSHMPAEQRLKLFIDVCHAIQHAHHKGVIHRDIKPSNVMVTLHDGVPVVKVIDFGVAKATVQKLTERTLFTAYGQMVGTPAYMSPEQAEMSGLDIDTRSDIYSLGVLLYELLTGTTPLEGKRLRDAGYAEMQRLIREEDAQRPSTRLSALGASATGLAGNRGTDPRQLARLLAGDLDWIVMKALEKDRNRRYGTPGDFAEDIERYLHHDAILARPPSTGYKLKKFVRRNRATAVTVGAIAVALLMGIAIATWQAVRADGARREAEVARHEAEEARRAAEVARRETTASLYQALLGRAAAERGARSPGYRGAVWSYLKQAIALDVANRDMDRVEHEVLACLSDFVGLESVPAADIPLAPIPAAGVVQPAVDWTALSHWRASRSGKYLATVESVKPASFAVWAGDKDPVGIVARTPGTIHDLRITVDDEFLVAGCEEGFAVWALPDLIPRMSVRGDSVTSIAVHPEGHLLATRSQLGRIEVWSLHSHRLVAHFNAPPAARRVEFSADGRFLVAADRQQGIHAWQVNGTPERIDLAGHRGGVTGISFSPDGRQLASVSKDRTVKLWNGTTGTLVRTLDGHQAELQGVDFSPDGRNLVTGDWAAEVRIWDPESGRLIWNTVSLAGQIWRIRFEPGNRFLIVCGNAGIEGWEPRREQGRPSFAPFLWRTGHQVRDIAFPKSGSGFATLSLGMARMGEVWQHTLGQTDQLLLSDAFFGHVLCLHFSRDGRLLYPTSVNTVGVWDWNDRKRSNDLQIPFQGYFISHDGEWLAGYGSETVNAHIRITRIATGEEGLRLPHDQGPIWCMCFSPDGSRLAIGHADGSLAIWKLDEVRARLSEFGIAAASTASALLEPAPPVATEQFESSMAAERQLLDDPARISRMEVFASQLWAGGSYREAIALYEEAFQNLSAKLGPEDDETLRCANSLAWKLTTAPERKLRDPQRAVEMAEKLVQSRPDSPAFWSTLGTARYEAGDWKGSIPNLEQCNRLLPPDDPLNAYPAFFLAQGYWQLGEKEVAREWFGKAVQWMENGKLDYADLIRIRRDTATLLEQVE